MIALPPGTLLMFGDAKSSMILLEAPTISIRSTRPWPGGDTYKCRVLFASAKGSHVAEIPMVGDELVKMAERGRL